VRVYVRILFVRIVICLILDNATAVPITIVQTNMATPAPVVSRGSATNVLPRDLGTALIVPKTSNRLPQKVSGVLSATGPPVKIPCFVIVVT